MNTINLSEEIVENYYPSAGMIAQQMYIQGWQIELKETTFNGMTIIYPVKVR